MAKREIDVEQIGKLLKLVEAHGLAELTVEEGDLIVTIKSSSEPAPDSSAAVSVPANAAQTQDSATSEDVSGTTELTSETTVEPELVGNIVDIVAPLVGVFYRAPAPDAPPFVEVGDHIEVGTEIGLIEAMKVFSPIPSDVAGEVVAIPAENGKLVQKGETLVRVRVEE